VGGIAISGLGLVSHFGLDPESLWARLAEGLPAFETRTLTDALAQNSRAFLAGYLREVDLSSELNFRGIRTWSRESKAVVSAAILATRNAKLNLEHVDRSRVGVFLGTMFSGLSGFSEAFYTGSRDGPEAINPSVAPETGFNGPASRVGISLQAQGPNVTISAGLASCICAIECAGTEVAADRCDYALAGGFDVLSYSYAAALEGSRPSRTNFVSELPRPFDRERTGPVYSEAAALFVLEKESNARTRGARLYGIIEALSLHFHPTPLASLKEALSSCLEEVLEFAGVGPLDIDAVFASANGDVYADSVEAAALDHVFGSETPISAVKGVFGEALGASAGLQVAAAVLAFIHQALPLTSGFSFRDPRLPALKILRTTINSRVRRVLISCVDESGFIGTAVLRAPAFEK
jgi:3-oxoacyl-[acyl-carrier-protein] synthase II